MCGVKQGAWGVMELKVLADRYDKMWERARVRSKAGDAPPLS